MALLEKNEIILLSLLALLGGIWAVLLNPYLQSQPWFYQLPPPIAYVIYNVGVFFLITGIFSLPSAILIKRQFKVNIPDLLVGGLMAFLLFSWVLDAWMPPLAYNTAGTLLVSPTSNLENVAGDYVMGWIFLALGAPAGIIYWLIYLVMPIAVLFLAALVYGQKEFIDFTRRILQ